MSLHAIMPRLKHNEWDAKIGPKCQRLSNTPKEQETHHLQEEAAEQQCCQLQVIFFPNRPGYVDPGVTRRIMDYLLFMNSKVLFTRVDFFFDYFSLILCVPQSNLQNITHS